MTPAEIAKIIAVVQAAWPDQTWDDQTIHVYGIGLEDIPYPAASQAVSMLIKRSRFCPRPSEIREVATEQLAATIPTVDAALSELHTALIAYWPHQTPTFSHPLIDQAVRVIGWRQISESEKPSVERAQFREAYIRLRESAVERVIRDPLGTGHHTVEFPTSPPRSGFKHISAAFTPSAEMPQYRENRPLPATNSPDPVSQYPTDDTDDLDDYYPEVDE